MSAAVDLNSDLGEGFGVWRLGDDAALLRIVTSANVACGFHAGDPSIMRAVAVGAVANDVAVGAQVSYRDLAGFGRRRMDVAPDDLTDDVLYQLGALDGLCRVAGTRVRYVKPHGALYNTCVDDDGQARAVVRAVKEYDETLPILGLPGSALLRHAERAGLTPVSEGFGWRPRGRWSRSTAPCSKCRYPPCVSTATVRALWTWPNGCATRSSRPASSYAASSEHPRERLLT
jgi:5-oxoprolinase (ATP-hydrolysing) subunit A